MDTNVYEPPRSDLIVEDNTPGSIVKAVVIGSVIETIGTIFVGLSAGIAYGFFLASQGSSAEDIQKAAEQMGPWSSFGFATSFLGLLVSIFSGYTCARIANTASYKAAFILSGISFTLGTVFGFGAYSWWALVLSGLISASAVLLGARLYIRKLSTT